MFLLLGQLNNFDILTLESPAVIVLMSYYVQTLTDVILGTRVSCSQGGLGFELYRPDQARRKHFYGGIKEVWSLNYISKIMRVGSNFMEVSRSVGG